MSNSQNPPNNLDHPATYQIKIKGHLGAEWAEWFGGLQITWEDTGETLLTGVVADQAVLHGLLHKLRDTGMTLISLHRIPANQTDTQVVLPKHP